MSASWSAPVRARRLPPATFEELRARPLGPAPDADQMLECARMARMGNLLVAGRTGSGTSPVLKALFAMGEDGLPEFFCDDDSRLVAWPDGLFDVRSIEDMIDDALSCAAERVLVDGPMGPGAFSRTLGLADAGIRVMLGMHGDEVEDAYVRLASHWSAPCRENPLDRVVRLFPRCVRVWRDSQFRRSRLEIVHATSHEGTLRLARSQATRQPAP